MPSQFLIINKPKGITSHDVVARLRKITGVQKIGHSGTLDPLAEGVLILAIERESTKALHDMIGLDKTYEAVVMLGAKSTTYDAKGSITPLETGEFHPPSRAHIQESVSTFLGNIKQIPPAFSAKKIHGQKLYELARKGIEISAKPSAVSVYEIAIQHYAYPRLSLRIHCSSGTYIRSLAHDLGMTLGVFGYIEELKRTAIGPVSIARAVSLESIHAQNAASFFVSYQQLGLSDYQKPRTRAVAFGTFDYLHKGHLNYFLQAKEYGDDLYVVVGRDETVKRVKHETAAHSEAERLAHVQALPLVHQALLGNLDDPYRVIRDINPHVICLGYDQQSFTNNLAPALSRLKLHPKIVRLAPYRPEIYKSTLYKQKNAIRA